MPERQQQLAHLESLGDAAQFAGQMHALIPKCPLLENFSQPEVELLPAARALDIPGRDHMLAVGDKVFKEGVRRFLAESP